MTSEPDHMFTLMVQHLTFDPGQSGGGGDGEAGQGIGCLLLVAIVAALHTSLVQCVVIAEDKLKEVPEKTSVEQLCL